MNYYEEIKKKLKPGVIYQLKERINFMDVETSTIVFTSDNYRSWKDENDRNWAAYEYANSKEYWRDLWENVIVEGEKSGESYYEKVKRIITPGVVYDLKKNLEFFNINLDTITFAQKFDGSLGFGRNLDHPNLFDVDETAEKDWCRLYNALLEVEEADITTETHLEKAARLYPEGTRFISPENGQTYTVISPDPSYSDKNYWEGSENEIVACTSKKDGGQFVCYNGKWAEILGPEKSINPFTVLKIGDAISDKILQDWSNAADNLTHDERSWRQGSSVLGDRAITKFDHIAGKNAFQVSGTASDVWFAADGFEEFHKSQVKRPTPEGCFPIGTIIKGETLNAWGRDGNNLIFTDEGRWKTINTNPFNEGRSIIEYGHIYGKTAFKITGTGSNAWLSAEKFKEFCENFETVEPVEEEFEVDDWVIGWFQDHPVIGRTPWQIGRITASQFIPKGYPHWGTGKKDVRKLSKKEVLEWASKEYPMGSKYLDVNPKTSHRGKQKVDMKPNFIGHDIEAGIGYIYYEGKWAERKATEPDFDGPQMGYSTVKGESSIAMGHESKIIGGADNYSTLVDQADVVMVINHKNKTVERYQQPLFSERYGYSKSDHNPFLLKTKSKKRLNTNVVSTKAVDIKIK